MKSVLSNDLLNLRSKLESIEKEFEEKLEIVKEKEEKHQKIGNQLEEFIATKDNTITLNIGGKKFLTKTSTLLSRKESLFNQLINSYIRDNVEIPNEFFFDRNFKHFKTILDYLRTGQINLKQFKNFDKSDIEEELEYYGLISKADKTKKIYYELEWARYNLKGCAVDSYDPKLLIVNTNTCYTYFLTNRIFNEEDFIVEFESTVTQSDYYFYFGIIPDCIATASTCMCCNPANTYYVQCNGSVHISAQTFTVDELAWNSAPVTIGMKVLLSERTIRFYIKDKFVSDAYKIDIGNNFTVVSGHCNSGNGTIKIIDCYACNKDDLI